MENYYTYGRSSAASNADAADACKVLYRLDRITEEAPATIPVALVMTHGKDARTVLQDVASAGMQPCAVYTEDHKAASYLRFAEKRVCLGEKYSDELFSNAYAVLGAALEAEAQVILLCEEALPLATVDAFLARAKRHGISVYATDDVTANLLGWKLCETERDFVEDEHWCTCRNCKLTFAESSLAKSYYTCPSCGTYYRLSSTQRINDLLDMDSFEEWNATCTETDPLDFPGYQEKLEKQREKTGLDEAVRTGSGRIAGLPCAIGVMEAGFFMGSMGSVVGDKVSKLFDRATEEGLPVIVFCASGGARMQEGLVSLMQMAKVSCAVERHSRAGLLYISIITDPTTGGVTASFATQGDIILAEPHALIGFAGKRVIQDTIRQELPKGFQTAEFALEHGLIDAIVPREELRRTLAQLLAMHRATTSSVEPGTPTAILTYGSVKDALETGRNSYNHVTYGRVPVTEIEEPEPGFFDALRKKLGIPELQEALGARDAVAFADGVPLYKEPRPVADATLSSEEPNAAWKSVQLARNTHRPTAIYYIRNMIDGFIELHGDRAFGDDGAIVGGIGWLGGQVVTVIAEEKGENLKERIARNFGCPQPEGYRKSLRLMRQAEKFGRPIICLVDTQGAFCGAEAEERGQGNAIAENLQAMAGLRVPVVSVLLGEGGSGGALALAVSNRVAMQEHAVYSVLSPEGFASILWKDRSRAAEAAAVMRMNANQVHDMGIIDAVLTEGDAPAHENPEQAARELRHYLKRSLNDLADLTPDELVAQRQERFAKF